MAQRLREAEAAATRLDQQLTGQRQMAEALQSSLAGKSSAEAALAGQLSQVRTQLADVQSQLTATTSERNHAQTDLADARQQVSLLQNEVKLVGQRLEAAQGEAREATAAHVAERDDLQARLQATQVGRV